MQTNSAQACRSENAMGKLLPIHIHHNRIFIKKKEQKHQKTRDFALFPPQTKGGVQRNVHPPYLPKKLQNGAQPFRYRHAKAVAACGKRNTFRPSDAELPCRWNCGGSLMLRMFSKIRDRRPFGRRAFPCCSVFRYVVGGMLLQHERVFPEADPYMHLDAGLGLLLGELKRQRNGL